MNEKIVRNLLNNMSEYIQKYGKKVVFLESLLKNIERFSHQANSQFLTSKPNIFQI